ncbi:multiple C2 and transmembrane domain-containing protein-like isoform X2 [Artemia franciscana]|uniref:multiple C2 and transmembrane domain-containing protein-like isoform X2 n=1 Tax=Artemia franciscana TaxID=6661 RepID=UPI0032DB3B1B
MIEDSEISPDQASEKQSPGKLRTSRRKRIHLLQRKWSKSVSDLSKSAAEQPKIGATDNGTSKASSENTADSGISTLLEVKVEGMKAHHQTVFGFFKSKFQRHNKDVYHGTDSSSAEPTPRSTPSSSPHLHRFVPFSRKRLSETYVQHHKKFVPVKDNLELRDENQKLSLCSRTKIGLSLDSLEDFGDKEIQKYQNTQEEELDDRIDAISTAENLKQEIEKVEREMERKKYELFDVRVNLIRARNLPAKDACGTSDPYVKFKHKNRLLYKSSTVYKNLNPVWQEGFNATVDDTLSPLYVKVFDYDWGFQDDFLGSGHIDLSSVDFHKPTDVTLRLKEGEFAETHGEIDLNITLSPKTIEEHEKQIHYLRTVDQTKRLKSQIWSAVVTIILVEGYNFTTKDGGAPGRPYIKLKLGQEKWKSKATQKSHSPSWREQFDFHLFEDRSILDVFYCDKESRNKDEIIGKFTLDLSKLERETTHRIRQNLVVDHSDGCISDVVGTLFLLLTISGSTSTESISDLTANESNSDRSTTLARRYGLLRTFRNLRDVGHLTVKVFRARGLAAADIGGKSDPYCVLELDNARLQTQTEYRTLTPNWYKIFTFQVKDINSALEVTVYDEDRSRRSDFLGMIVIPLLRINNGERRWFTLKDRTLRTVAEGNNPEILLELFVEWNSIRGALRTLQPKEKKYMDSSEGFSRIIFMRNVTRLKAVGKEIYSIVQFFESCFEWESPIRSGIAFLSFIVGSFYFEPFMVPLALLPFFLKNYIVNIVSSGRACGSREVDFSDVSGGSAAEEDDDKEEKKSLKMKLQAIQEVTQTVQNSIGYMASLGEQVKNTFNFTVPFLSWLAVFLLFGVSLLLYLINIRWLIMIWGTIKFTRKLVRPTSVPNNELLDFLSRVPDKESLIQSREVPHNDSPISVRNKKRKM